MLNPDTIYTQAITEQGSLGPEDLIAQLDTPYECEYTVFTSMPIYETEQYKLDLELICGPEETRTLILGVHMAGNVNKPQEQIPELLQEISKFHKEYLVDLKNVTLAVKYSEANNAKLQIMGNRERIEIFSPLLKFFEDNKYVTLISTISFQDTRLKLAYPIELTGYMINLIQVNPMTTIHGLVNQLQTKPEH